jgi:hypothetical protein
MNYEVSINFNVLNTIPLSLRVPNSDTTSRKKIEQINEKPIPYDIISKYFEG